MVGKAKMLPPKLCASLAQALFADLRHFWRAVATVGIEGIEGGYIFCGYIFFAVMIEIRFLLLAVRQW